MKKKSWVVVANGSIARILTRNNEENHWAELECLIHPEGRLHGTDLSAGEVRHSIAGRVGLARRQEPKQHARQEFAQLISNFLRQHINNNEIENLVIFASNPFLGELLQHLDLETRKIVSSSYSVDLTHLNLDQMEQRLDTDFKIK